MMNVVRKFWSDTSGMSVTETALLFPVLISLMMAIYDLGQGVVVNQKTVAAAQVVADLVGRSEVVDMELLTDIRNAGELSLAPYSTVDFGSDIISVQFDEDGDATILWRLTENMTGDDGALDSTDGLGAEGEGVVIVSIANQYRPFFSGFVVPEINMRERAFVRGRRSATVMCSDCP